MSLVSTSAVPAHLDPAAPAPVTFVPPFAVVDIGTNSIRLGVVKPEPGRAYSLLALHKESIRLGEGEFATNHLTPAAINRGILVLSKFADVARGYGVSDITVLGTAALREAANQNEFVERAHDDAGVEVTVISGAEEARLIFLGVASGVDLGTQRALVMDIGGGSTELAVGDGSGPEVLESLKLGAIRMAGIFTEGEAGPIQPQLYRRMQDYVRGVAVHSLQRVRESGFQTMYGSSGTIMNLAEIAIRARLEGSEGRSRPVQLDELEAQAARLCALPVELRRKVPGINPERADIIVPGAAVLTSIMRELGVTEITISERALREGIIADRLNRMFPQAPDQPQDPIRLRSVLQLARRCQFEEAHARVVAGLTCDLFDQFRELSLHDFGTHERELAHYGALLHDVGGFVSYTDHHRHGYYLVRYSPLLGFDSAEIQMMAAIVQHHRKSLPKRKSESVADLNRRQRHVVTVLSTLVRLAEAMDRGHLAQVRGVRVLLEDKGRTLMLELEAESDCQLELWGLRNHAAAVLEVFGRILQTRQKAA